MTFCVANQLDFLIEEVDRKYTKDLLKLNLNL